MEQNPTASTKSNGEQLLEKGNKWLERIKATEKREDDWSKDAEAAEKTYSCDPKARYGKIYDFNILHSNVETIVPAIYNSTPVPDVRRRFTLAIGEPPQPPQQQPGPVGQPAQPDPQIMQQFQQQMQAWQEKLASDQAAKDFGTMIERTITVLIDDNRLDKEVESVSQDSFLGGRGMHRSMTRS